MTDNYKDREALQAVARVLELNSDRPLHLIVPDALREKLRSTQKEINLLRQIDDSSKKLVAGLQQELAVSKDLIEAGKDLIESQKVVVEAANENVATADKLIARLEQELEADKALLDSSGELIDSLKAVNEAQSKLIEELKDQLAVTVKGESQ